MCLQLNLLLEVDFVRRGEALVFCELHDGCKGERPCLVTHDDDDDDDDMKMILKMIVMITTTC